jgi:Zn-dependent protease
MAHEVAHGSVALALGDSTAKDEGRLTLNPLKHIDPFGTIFLPLILALIPGNSVIIGWAKPVPINFNNITDKKFGALKVSLAGPLSNFVLATVFALIIRFIPVLNPEMNFIFTIIIFYNLILGIFNLIPIPPLDGSHILFDLLPQGQTLETIKSFLYQYGIFILIFVLFIFPRLDWIYSLTEKIFSLLTGQPLTLSF